MVLKIKFSLKNALRLRRIIPFLQQAVVFAFALCIWPNTPLAQNSDLVVKLENSHGIPETGYSRMIQSPNGYYWIASNKGLLRFDGRKTVVYGTNEGLPSRAVTYAANYEGGRILVRVFNLGYWFLKNNRFYPHPINKILNDSMRLLIKSESISGDTLRVGLRGSIVAANLSGYKQILDLPPSKHNGFNTIDTSFYYNVCLSGNNCVMRLFNKTHVSTLRYKSEAFKTVQTKNFRIPKPDASLRSQLELWQIHVARKIDTLLIIAVGRKLYWWNTGTTTFLGEMTLPYRIIALERIRGRILAGTQSGYYKLDLEKRKFEPGPSILGKAMVSSFLEDREGYIWITSSKGLFRLPRLPLEMVHQKSLETPRFIKFTKNGQYLTLTNGLLICWKGNEIKWTYVTIKPVHSFLVTDDFIYLSDGSILNSMGKLVQNKPNLPYSHFLEKHKDQVYSIYAKKLYTIKSKKLIKYSSPYLLGSLNSYQNMLLLGSRRGVLYLDEKENTINPFKIAPEIDSIPIYNIYGYEDTLVISTSKGVYFVDSKSKAIIYNWHKGNGMSSNFSNKTIIHKDWIFSATQNGLNIGVLKNGEIQTINILNSSSGLPRKNIRDIAVFNDTLYIVTSVGIVHIALCDFSPPRLKIPFFLEQILINGKHVGIDSVYNLSYNQNSIQIHFNSVLIEHYSENLPYRYILQSNNGRGKQWIYISDQSIDLSDLAHGKYKFIIQTANALGLYTTSKSIRFNISPRIIDQLWFQILILLTAFFLTYLFFSYLLRRARNNHKLKMDILSYENESLKSQMNPHFLFNALNTAQGIIIEGDKKKALSHISRLAKLLRSALIFTSEELISLEEEIRFIENYINVERNKTNGSFEYSIQVSQEINLSKMKVPPLISQPVIENAIKHGFDAINHKGHISLTITKTKKTLRFHIEDNGKGLAQSINRPDSSGIKNIRRRLQLLNKKYKTSLNILTIESPIYESQNTAGTRVLIELMLF